VEYQRTRCERWRREERRHWSERSLPRRKRRKSGRIDFREVPWLSSAGEGAKEEREKLSSGEGWEEGREVRGGREKEEEDHFFRLSMVGVVSTCERTDSVSARHCRTGSKERRTSKLHFANPDSTERRKGGRCTCTAAVPKSSRDVWRFASSLRSPTSRPSRWQRFQVPPLHQQRSKPVAHADGAADC
jgi:hypothetical protein